MPQLYTRQAQAFINPDDGLYNRPPANPLLPFMIRMTAAVRSVPGRHREPAIHMIESHVFESWGRIHREMRDYFFTDMEAVTAAYKPWKNAAIDFPDGESMARVIPDLHFMLNILIDLDRVTMLLHSDPDAENVSDRVMGCWNALYRATARAEGLENRIRSGKAFKGG